MVTILVYMDNDNHLGVWIMVTILVYRQCWPYYCMDNGGHYCVLTMVAISVHRQW